MIRLLVSQNGIIVINDSDVKEVSIKQEDNFLSIAAYSNDGIWYRDRNDVFDFAKGNIEISFIVEIPK